MPIMLQPILVDEDPDQAIYLSASSKEVLKTFSSYYRKIGFNPPWIGYFIILENQIVGTCSFTGKPKDGKVEIAYYTFTEFEGKGIASLACRELITICKTTDPNLILTAKTSPEPNASTAILSRNGFILSGEVADDDIGKAWEWVYQGLEEKKE